MRYTINLIGQDDPATIKAEAGRVVFNGRAILPFEAAMLADALNECAESAESMAAKMAAQVKPDEWTAEDPEAWKVADDVLLSTASRRGYVAKYIAKA